MEKEFNGYFVYENKGTLYATKNETAARFNTDDDIQTLSNIDSEIDSQLFDLADSTRLAGDDCTAYTSDAEDLLKNEGYSIKYLQRDWSDNRF